VGIIACAPCPTPLLNLNFELRPSWNNIYDTFPARTTQGTILHSRTARTLNHRVGSEAKRRTSIVHWSFIRFFDWKGCCDCVSVYFNSVGIPFKALPSDFFCHFVVYLDIFGRMPKLSLEVLAQRLLPRGGGGNDRAAKSEVLTAVQMKIHILQAPTPRSYWNFGGTPCLHLQDPRSLRYFLTLMLEAGSCS
jgi:hypothetical protein